MKTIDYSASKNLVLRKANSNIGGKMSDASWLNPAYSNIDKSTSQSDYCRANNAVRIPDPQLNRTPKLFRAHQASKMAQSAKGRNPHAQ